MKQLTVKVGQATLTRFLSALLKPLGHQAVKPKSLLDLYLYEYESFDEYKRVQTFHNKRKIREVWADDKTLTLVGEKLTQALPGRKLKGICHGTRNGFEQKFLNEKFGFEVIGTEISDTATDYENTVEWDFHQQKDEWVGAFDFVYSNSHDQGWHPQKAIATWLHQLKDDGLLVLEHTDAHSPRATSEMDPFGVRPTVLPFVLIDWFGHSISIEVVESVKANNNFDAYFYFIRRIGPIEIPD